MITALKDTMNLLGLRYQIIRDTKGKIFLWFFITALAFGIVAVSYTGDFIKLMASTNSENTEAAKIYATTYLTSYINGELGTLVAATLGLALVSVMISPFTGASATSLISHHYLVSVRSSMKHRFTDSLVTQFFSSISLLQLMTLTMVASLLTIDGGRKSGILYAWASWPVLVALSTVFVWVAEYLYRRFGEVKRITMLSFVLAVIIAVCFFNQEEASTVFGIGTGYATIIQNIDNFTSFEKFISFAILGILWLLFVFIAYKVSHVALSHPDLFAKQERIKKTIKPRKFSAIPAIELFNLVFMQLWRNVEIRKPLITATGISMIIMFILSSGSNSISTVVFIIPLMVSLSWGANIFGIIGNGLPWIISKPYATKNIMWIFGGLQMFVILVMATATVIPVMLLNKLDANSLASFLVSLIACSALMTRSSLAKSLHSPYPYKSGARGEPILPPATLVSYTIRFSMWSGFYGLLMYSLTSDILIQLGLMALAVVWSLVRMKMLNRKFATKPEVRNKIIFTVASN